MNRLQVVIATCRNNWYFSYFFYSNIHRTLHSIISFFQEKKPLWYVEVYQVLDSELCLGCGKVVFTVNVLADVISFLWGFFGSFVLFEYSQDCSGMVCVWHFSYHNEPIFRAFSPVKLLHPFMGFPVPSFVMCERTLYFFCETRWSAWRFMTGHRFNCPRFLFLKV